MHWNLVVSRRKERGERCPDMRQFDVPMCYGLSMVIGIGTDLIEISRVARSIERFGDAFLGRIFTPQEIAFCRAKNKGAAESFAARFAAKEAGAKALGTGISRGVGWKEFEVERQPGHRPMMRLRGRAAELAEVLGVTGVSLSLTHSRDLAMAVVVLEA